MEPGQCPPDWQEICRFAIEEDKNRPKFSNTIDEYNSLSFATDDSVPSYNTVKCRVNLLITKYYDQLRHLQDDADFQQHDCVFHQLNMETTTHENLEIEPGAEEMVDEIETITSVEIELQSEEVVTEKDMVVSHVVDIKGPDEMVAATDTLVVKEGGLAKK